MNKLQRNKLEKVIRADIVAIAIASLMLMDNMFGDIIAGLVTVFLVYLWGAMIIMWRKFQDDLDRELESMSWQLFILNTVVSVAMLGIVFNAPVDNVWSGVMFGLYLQISLASAWFSLKELLNR